MRGVICPKCLQEAAVTVDLDDGDTLRCPECEDTYTLGDVRAVVESWGRLLPWLESHPARVEPAVA